MVKFDLNEILESSKENFERTWEETANLLERKGTKFSLDTKKGKTHPVYDFINEARKILVHLGFEEIVLPMFVDEEDIYKEYGSEAALILDRVFYLAELPRPDIGLSNKKIDHVRRIVPRFTQFAELKKILKEYKIGKIEADDFLEVMVDRMDITQGEASGIVDHVFPEFKELKPIPSKRTLRSHTTALWFPVLGALQGKTPLPIQLFHMGPKFRREQKLDASHLYESNTMSLVVSSEEITLEDCMAIAREICLKIGFKDAKFEIKKATGKYYAPGMEFEIFVKHGANEEWLEIGDGGFYSPISCVKYGIEQPVFNIGFGVERISMIKAGVDDIRKLVYPYYYREHEFTDEEIISLIKINKKPRGKDASDLIVSIQEAINSHGDDEAPCEVEVGEYLIDGTRIKVVLWEHETGVKLVSKAIKNEIVVKDGEINCFDGSKHQKPECSISTGITFTDGILNDFAWHIERFIKSSDSELIKQYKMVKKASDVNVSIDPAILRFTTDRQKKIKISGPLFVNLKAIKIE
ncbi:MAG: O-phosphoserine--tRNA ligase [Promethearchaeota archaeon]